jgi:Flp pilus assembly protein TadD
MRTHGPAAGGLTSQARVHYGSVVLSCFRLVALLALCLGLSAASAQLLPAGPTARVPAPPTEAQAIQRLMEANQSGDALARADAVLGKNPRDAQVRFLRAVILTDQKKLPEATAALEALNQDFPELPEPYNNLAVLHAGQGRHDVARRLLLQAIEVAPGYATAHENLGDLYVAMAGESYARAARLVPDNRALATKLKLARDTQAQLRGPR